MFARARRAFPARTAVIGALTASLVLAVAPSADATPRPVSSRPATSVSSTTPTSTLRHAPVKKVVPADWWW